MCVYIHIYIYIYTRVAQGSSALSSSRAQTRAASACLGKMACGETPAAPGWGRRLLARHDRQVRGATADAAVDFVTEEHFEGRENTNALRYEF